MEEAKVGEGSVRGVGTLVRCPAGPILPGSPSLILLEVCMEGSRPDIAH